MRFCFAPEGQGYQSLLHVTLFAVTGGTLQIHVSKRSGVNVLFFYYCQDEAVPNFHVCFFF